MDRKPIKDGWIGARVDKPYEMRVKEYINRADMTQGQLIRKAVDEFMANHPQKRKIGKFKVYKPGE